MRGHRVQHMPRGSAGGLAFGVGGESGQHGGKIGRQPPLQNSIPALGQVRMGLPIRGEPLIPGTLRRAAGLHRLAHRGVHFVRHREGRLVRPAKGLAGQAHLSRAEGFAVDFARASFVGAAVANRGATSDEAGAVTGAAGLLNGFSNRGLIVAVHRLGVPAIRLEALERILGKREVS